MTQPSLRLSLRLGRRVYQPPAESPRVGFLVVSGWEVKLLLSVSVGVSAGRRPRHRLRSFVVVLSSLQEDQEASESSTFEVSPPLALSANSPALKSLSLWMEQKAGLTRLSLCVCV